MINLLQSLLPIAMIYAYTEENDAVFFSSTLVLGICSIIEGILPYV